MKKKLLISALLALATGLAVLKGRPHGEAIEKVTRADISPTLPSTREKDQQTAPLEKTAKASSTPEDQVTSEPETKWEPTGAQSVALDRAIVREEEWEKRRNQFLASDLNLTEAQMNKISKLRSDFVTTEKDLMERTTSTEEEEALIRRDLESNRQLYEGEMRKVLGENNWRLYMAFYLDFWDIKSNRVAIHLPLK